MAAIREPSRVRLTQERVTFPGALRLGERSQLAGNNDVTELCIALQLRGMFRTGDVLVNESAGRGFETHVNYDGMNLRVPIQFMGRTDCALVIKNSNLRVIGSEMSVRDAGSVIVVENFPAINGQWHLPHEETGIPQGGVVKPSTPGAMRLWRQDGPFIGSVVRYGDYSMVYDAREVRAHHGPDELLHVALLERE